MGKTFDIWEFWQGSNLSLVYSYNCILQNEDIFWNFRKIPSGSVHFLALQLEKFKLSGNLLEVQVTFT